METIIGIGILSLIIWAVGSAVLAAEAAAAKAAQAAADLAKSEEARKLGKAVFNAAVETCLEDIEDRRRRGG